MDDVVTAVRRQRKSRSDGKFAARIRRLRMQQGLTQVEVATLAGIGERTYRNWENEETVPNPGAGLRGLAAAFRVSPGFLLQGDEED